VLLMVVAVGVWLNWSAVSLRGNRRVYDFAAHLLREVEPSTMIVNHWVTASVLDYLRIVEGQRPDVASFNLDFYFLGAQTECDMPDALAQMAWFSWLSGQLVSRPLCFIEPLPSSPSNLHWVREGTCWQLRVGREEQ